MMYKALISFTGKTSMAMGDVKEIKDVALANDLLRCGYIAEINPEKKVSPKVTEKKKSPRRKEKKDGN